MNQIQIPSHPHNQVNPATNRIIASCANPAITSPSSNNSLALTLTFLIPSTAAPASEQHSLVLELTKQVALTNALAKAF